MGTMDSKFTSPKLLVIRTLFNYSEPTHRAVSSKPKFSNKTFKGILYEHEENYCSRQQF